jgi:EAL and modified HD-GYP domain-containing signal transduction protein
LATGDNSSPLPFPPAQLVIVLNETLLPDGMQAENCRAKRAQGARLAVTGLEAAPGLVPDMISAHILDAATARDTLGEEVLQNACNSGAKLFAQHVDSMALFKWYAAQGFGYFTFGRLNLPENNGAPRDTSRLPLMRLLSLVTGDADTAEMEAVFKLEPKLAFELLRLVNSMSFGLRTEITSFAQAILVLGRRQLQRWLQLLLFAHRKDGEDGPNILMQRAAERGRVMELLAQKGNEKADQEMAFMVGVFSVLDVLMATPLAELFKSITLPQPVEQALLRREGRLGKLLNLVCAAEESHFAEIRRQLPSLGLDSGTLSRSQLAAIFWALRI